MSKNKEENVENFVIKPIGIVRSNYREASLKYQNRDLKLDEDILSRSKTGKDQISELIIYETYEECLEGIEDFSHIIVLYWSHTVGEEARSVYKVHPAGKNEFPMVGVFATRSPIRPNPICSTTVELLERDGRVLKVIGLDALDRSPIIDIKFHHPSYDSPSNVELADWMEELLDFFRNKTK
ncbi:MAG: tRNA (N6-threonylcarbamoyladenosine(37)-N6)-methyltransferase TrmO [Promethearchaeati archaeon]